MHTKKIDENLNQQNAISSILSLKLILERCDPTCDLVADRQYEMTLDALMGSVSVLGPNDWEEKLSPQLHKIYPLMSEIRKSAVKCALVNRALPDRRYKSFTQHYLLQIDEFETLVGQLVTRLESDSALTLALIKSMASKISFIRRSFGSLNHRAIKDSLSKEDKDLLELAQLIEF